MVLISNSLEDIKMSKFQSTEFCCCSSTFFPKPRCLCVHESSRTSAVSGLKHSHWLQSILWLAAINGFSSIVAKLIFSLRALNIVFGHSGEARTQMIDLILSFKEISRICKETEMLKLSDYRSLILSMTLIQVSFRFHSINLLKFHKSNIDSHSMNLHR